jgi:glycosyltransferase involved in cell wall biosynthesis
VSRTVLVTPSWQVSVWNGVARISESVAEALSMLGRDVIVVTPQIPNGGAHRRWADGIQVLEVEDTPKGMWKKNASQAIQGLRNIVEAFCIDSSAWQASKDILTQRNIPIIGVALFGQSVQGEKIASPKTDASIEEENEFIRSCSRLLANNEVLRNRINTAFEREVGKLEMAASLAPETEALLSIPAQKIDGSVVVVGKIGPELGVEKVIRAMVDLPWLKLRIIGMPRSEWEMKRMSYLIGRLGLESRIEFVGWARTRDVLAAIRSAELLVAPSLVEYFGYSVMDAMLMETAVIASTANIHIELIEDCDSGMLFQNQEELKHALNTMHDAIELRQSYVARSSYKIKELRSIKIMADSLAVLVGV